MSSPVKSLYDETHILPLAGLEKWERAIPYEIPSTANLSAAETGWLNLASGNGYVREASLRALKGPAPNSFLLAIAIRRLNDWVPQVQEAARVAIPLLIRSSRPRDVAEAVCTIMMTWNSWGRVDKVNKRLLINSIQEPKILSLFKQRILNSSSGPNATIFTQLGLLSSIDPFLEEIARDAVQPSVRAKAYQSMLAGEFIWADGKRWEWTDMAYCKGRYIPIVCKRELSTNHAFLATLESAGHDRSSIVRKVAAENLIMKIEEYGDALKPLAKQFASDSAYSVSFRGDYALKNMAEPK